MTDAPLPGGDASPLERKLRTLATCIDELDVDYALDELLMQAVDALTLARQQVTDLEKQVYIGERHFPDLTWKARAEELVVDLRAAEAQVTALEEELAALRQQAK